MNLVAAILLGLAVVAAQVLHGGLAVPALVFPSYALLVAAALAAVVPAMRNSAPTSPFGMAGVAVFLGYVVWRCAYAHDQFLGRMEMGEALAGGLAFAVGCGGLTDNRSRAVFLGVVGVAAVAQAAVGFIQFSRGSFVAPLGWFSLDLKAAYESRFPTRALGLYLNPNQFSWLMSWAALFCVSLACWARVGVVVRVLLIYLALVFIAANVFSGSRGGVLSLLAGMVFFGLVSIVAVIAVLRRGRAFAISIALLLLVLCLAVGAYIYSSNWILQGRIDAMQVVGDVRTFLLEHARRQFEVTPLTGAGPGAFRYAARLYRTDIQPNDAIYAHDDWLQTMVDYGFVGGSLALLAVLILLGGGIGRFFSVLRRQAAYEDRPQSNSAALLLGAITATIAFCIHSFTDFNMHIPANALLAGATLGLLAGTGGKSATPSRRLPLVLLRTVAAVGIVVIGGALGFFVWSHGVADFSALRAANAFAGGDVKDGLAEANKGLKFRPNDAQLQTLRGRGLYDFESAAELALPDSGADMDVKGPDGEPLTPEKRRALYEGASESFSAAIAQRPMERELLVRRADAQVETGRGELARKDLIAAIRLDPSHAYAYGAYGDFLYEEGQLGRALRIYSLGAALPGGSYCGRQAAEVREELGPAAATGGGQ